MVEALEKQWAARVSGLKIPLGVATQTKRFSEVEAELLFSFRCCEVQCAAIKSDCCK